MSMPRGKRVECGYATVKDGGDYRMIAETLTKQGFKMNHSSARNHFISIMRGIAEDLLIARGEDHSEEEVIRIARTPTFQAAVRDMYETHLQSN